MSLKFYVLRFISSSNDVCIIWLLDENTLKKFISLYIPVIKKGKRITN